jgi:hypothetical protein
MEIDRLMAEAVRATGYEIAEDWNRGLWYA